MIESVLILDATTRQVLKRVSHDTDRPHLTNLAPGEILSSRHDGGIGWTLTEAGEWIDPNPSLRWTRAQGIRNRRDYYLKSSDYIMTTDFPISQEIRAQWQEYRQLLRDITKQPGFPSEVVWPTKPET